VGEVEVVGSRRSSDGLGLGLLGVGPNLVHDSREVIPINPCHYSPYQGSPNNIFKDEES